MPTVVTRAGWARDLPEEAVVALPGELSPEALGYELFGLLGDSARRSALATAGREVAHQRTFALSARALLSYVERLPAARAR